MFPEIRVVSIIMSFTDEETKAEQPVNGKDRTPI
jgi:hypothetical protein